MNSCVYISKCDDYSKENVNRAMKELIDACGGLDWVTPGMKVGIKLNLCTALAPEKAATTHPALALCLAGMIAERGGTAIIGDSPGGPFVPAFINKLYEITELKKYHKNGNYDSEKIIFNENYTDSEVEFPEALSVKKFRYCNWLKECDEIINFCKLKSHGLTGMTAAVKNLYGVIPGTIKCEYHFQHTDPLDFANMLVDLNEFVKPRINIVDAVEIMEGNGPTKGTPRHMGLIYAGENPYYVDRIGAKLLGVGEDEIPYLIAARKRGLLTEDSNDFELKEIGADDTDILKQYSLKDFVRSGSTVSWFASSPEDKGLHKAAKRMLFLLMRSKPVTTSGCTGCGHCANMCPARAITIKNGKAVIDRKKCITCFCCQEFCPTGAMKVKRPWIAKLLG